MNSLCFCWSGFICLFYIYISKAYTHISIRMAINATTWTNTPRVREPIHNSSSTNNGYPLLFNIFRVALLLCVVWKIPFLRFITIWQSSMDFQENVLSLSSDTCSAIAYFSLSRRFLWLKEIVFSWNQPIQNRIVKMEEDGNVAGCFV